ncbi:Eukaryotic-type DNA primase, large subunit family protein [Tritrichomonas foetus]|uniref:Eukaryotic-type DNA primase, large subunit family protein n=1 Tax=Tritrichomonas foetus TaxID=1144522 RepID=A0A1J4JQ53_9EUKA|nr:Eukaryotic-type DNA primase, large subunit family protein [Tritrichomonas foetus]|eukprot:OHT00544.1 Eukaryotic-type DNA primase, large subunit family protein [Tritrichomonas foetus]
MKQIKDYISSHSTSFSFDKTIPTGSDYIPTYSHTPKIELQYSDILSFAIRRMKFHDRLNYMMKNEDLTYNKLRSIGIEFCIPFIRLYHNEIEILTDQISFYSLLMVVIGNNDMKDKFIEREKLLMYQRFRVSNQSIIEINKKFMPDSNLRNKLISSYQSNENGGVFRLEFETAFRFFNLTSLKLENGYAILTTNNVYEIAVYYFGQWLEKIITKFSSKTKFPAIESIAHEFNIIAKKDKKPLLTLENIEEVYKRSFPPCMFRIYESLKRSGILTFKAHLELVLFLKGCGLDYYSQLEFWKIAKNPNLVNLKSAFRIDDKGKDYSPHSCVTMATREFPRNVYQAQGCPFRYMARSELKIFAKKMNRGLMFAELEQVAEKVPDHPQIACRLFFDLVHKENTFPRSGISHPVEFFNHSEKRIRSKESHK